MNDHDLGYVDVQRIANFSPGRDADRLQIVRHVVAMANSGGGRVVLGSSGALDDDDAAGLEPVQTAALFEGDTLGDLIDDFVRPDRVEVGVDATTVASGRVVIELRVGGTAMPPLVLSKAGVYADTFDHEHTVFGAGTVLTRRNGRTVGAQREDYLAWRADAVAEVRRHLHERLALVIEAPPEAQIRVLTNDEVRDRASFFLSRAADLFQVQPDRLLSAQDLVYLWLHRDTLVLDDRTTELLFQSALRRRTTLYPWLAVLPITAEQARGWLFAALDMRDRDKSDGAKAILLVGALYFDASIYGQLSARLAASTYAHMREAVAALPDTASAVRQLENERLAPKDREQAAGLSATELLARIDAILAKQGSSSRRVPGLGLELLDRRRQT